MHTEKGIEQRQRLRKYELDRLKYYFAVVECDSIETADALYKAADGVEFENSGLRLDLRFISDEELFEHQVFLLLMYRLSISLSNVLCTDSAVLILVFRRRANALASK